MQYQDLIHLYKLQATLVYMGECGAVGGWGEKGKEEEKGRLGRREKKTPEGRY